MKTGREIRTVAAAGLVAFALISANASAQSVDPSFWVANGPVQAMARDGNTLYIGGSFTQLGPPTGSGVAIDASSGAVAPGFPKVTGTVFAVAPDGAGGWYIGGEFTHVGGLARQDLAHIQSNFSVSAWNPGTNGQVEVLAVSGSTIYVGGTFSSVGGQTRNRIAAVAANGTTTSWDPNSNGAVRALGVSGSMVYAGGAFTSIGGASRSRIAALDATTGVATSWDPSANGGSIVFALAINGSTVYAGGNFNNIGGQSRNRIAALDASTGNATSWNPNADARVDGIVVSGSTVYTFGIFGNIGGQARSRLAALNASTGLATSWNPDPTSDVFALAVNGSTVYAGGQFTTIGGAARNGLGALDATTGNATSWNPDPNSSVRALSADASLVFAGGGFTSLGGLIRNNIAAIDLATGEATAWDPDADGAVLALAIMGTTVYAGGQFNGIGGDERSRIAALSATTGLATSWNPGANGDIQALAVSGPSVYAGGTFTSIAGTAALRVAAIDRATGFIAGGWDWSNASANANVFALLLDGSTLYVGGGFTSIGGQARVGAAALDATTGLATGWNPGVTGGSVEDLALGEGVIYVAGFFNTVNTQTRNRIAALDATTALPTGWNPNANSTVHAIAVSGTRVYAGGLFTTIGGQSRTRLAALDATSGLATAWDPTSDGSIEVMAVNGALVYAGGFFLGVGNHPSSYLAAIAASPAVTSVAPESGGNAGSVTVTIYGSGLASGYTLLLQRFGQPDIPGTELAAAADGTSITATFDLTGAFVGSWDVVVMTPDDETGTLQGGFTIEEVEAPQLRVSVMGPSLQTGNLVVRRDRRTAYDLVIDNPGNVDASYVPLWLAGIPTDATVELDFALSFPEQAGGEPDWTTVPLFFASAGGKYVPLVIPVVPPGITTRRVYITVPGPTHPPFTLTAAVTPPWVDGNKFRSCIVGGGITDPACAGSELDAINGFIAGEQAMVALSGIALWAKVAWQCEGAGTLPAALAKAEQVLDYLEGPVEGGSAGAGCEDVLGTWWREILLVSVVSSLDPNDKLGAQGTLTGTQALPYTIRFENFSTATAPAQQVVVTDQLDPTKMELNTVSLDAIQFGSVQIHPPPGLKSYSTRVDLRPTTNLLVDVAASLDPFTHVLSWYFTSIDPATGQAPSSATVGFLPPNLTPPQGEGSVLFTVMPKSGLANGTVISNGASILFDDPPATNTPSWSNGLDNGAPASHVLALSANSNQPSIPVSWMADGSPPDLRDFTLYVKQDAGPYRVWRLNTSATSDTLVPPQDHQLHTFSFYSVARDQIGNIEAPPAGSPPTPDATTQSTTDVGGGATAALALRGTWPNPVVGALHVSLTLPGREAATLELLDVAGRRVLRREVGSLGPGAHVVSLDATASLRPGLYFLQLIRGSDVQRARVAVIR